MVQGQVVQSVLFFQVLAVFQAGQRQVDGGDPRAGQGQGVVGGLIGAAAGDQHPQAVEAFALGPEQGPEQVGSPEFVVAAGDGFAHVRDGMRITVSRILAGDDGGGVGHGSGWPPGVMSVRRGGCVRGRAGRIAERDERQQGADESFVVPPAFLAGFVDRLACLPVAGGADASLGLVKVQATCIPVQADEL